MGFDASSKEKQKTNYERCYEALLNNLKRPGQSISW